MPIDKPDLTRQGDEAPWSAEAAAERLKIVAPIAGVSLDRVVQFESDSNDAWLCGDVVLRVCWRGDRQRLLREAFLGAELPPEIGYPRVLDAGLADDLSWMMLAPVRGIAPRGTWKSWPEPQQRSIVRELAERMRLLHAWNPPAAVLDVMRAHDERARVTGDDAVGNDLLVLPVSRVAVLSAHAAQLPFVDALLIDATTARIAELAAHDPFAAPCERVVHGDLGFTNMLVSDGRITALLDFEWARLGPPDAELVSLMRWFGQWKPQRGAPLPPAWEWLRSAYPALFAAPDLEQRLWLTELVYVLRQLVVWPPDGPAETQDPLHPVHTLPLLLEAPWAWS